MKSNNCYIAKLLSCLLAIILVSLLTSHFSPPAYAQVPESWTEIGENTFNNSTHCVQNGVATIQGFECIFINVTRILTPIAGLAVFAMFIVGAFQMITAGGEAKQIQKARNTLTFAILGLVVFIGIWFILNLIKIITGVDVTKFEIPGP